MMCGCDKPAGGTMKKALQGGGCGHQFNFRTGAPLGEGRMGHPVNERQWKFMPENPAARLEIQRNMQPIPAYNRAQNNQVKRAAQQGQKQKTAIDPRDTLPVPFVVREPLEIGWEQVERLVTPMALPEELNLLQVLKGMDERPQCSYCYGSGRKKKDGKYAEDDSPGRIFFRLDEAKAEAPENVVIFMESNPTVVDELKTIFSDQILKLLEIQS